MKIRMKWFHLRLQAAEIQEKCIRKMRIEKDNCIIGDAVIRLRWIGQTAGCEASGRVSDS